MDEKRQNIKKYLETADISEELKVKELAIVNNPDLSTSEVEMELSQLLVEEADKVLAEAGIPDLPADDSEVVASLKEFELEVAQVEQDLAADMKLVDDSLQEIRVAAEEIQKVSLQTDLANS